MRVRAFYAYKHKLNEAHARTCGSRRGLGSGSQQPSAPPELCVDRLVNRLNARKQTPLILAASRGHAETVGCLLRMVRLHDLPGCADTVLVSMLVELASVFPSRPQVENRPMHACALLVARDLWGGKSVYPVCVGTCEKFVCSMPAWLHAYTVTLHSVILMEGVPTLRAS